MANDIIGGPEPILINRRLFYFSPLNDLEFSALDAWVSWRQEQRTSIFSEIGWSELATIEGSAQLLYQSTHRGIPDTVVELAQFIEGDEETAEQIFEEWYQLNFVDGLEDFEPEAQSEPSNQLQKIKSDEMYLCLSAMYKWTPQQIALLTPYQQLVYSKRVRMRMKQKTLYFATPQEYMEWKHKNGK